MHFTGEIISLAVALSWTATAIFAEYASQRLGSLTLNLIRMGLSILLLAALLWVVSGSPFPVFADSQTWLWLALSGLVGYVFGDFCLFNSYIVFGSRYGQLFMTLAPPIAGFLADSSWRVTNMAFVASHDSDFVRYCYLNYVEAIRLKNACP